MARGYIRPEVPESLYQEMLGGRRILINPTLEELSDTLGLIQHRTRSRRLEPQGVQDAWQQFTEKALPEIGLAAAMEAPAHYRWPLRASVFQAVRLTDALNGAVFNRVAIPAGTRLNWPVPPDAAGTKRSHAIITAFWLHLSDQEIAQVLL